MKLRALRESVTDRPLVEIAAAVGVSVSHLSRAERGERRLADVTTYRISTVLRLPVKRVRDAHRADIESAGRSK